MHNVKSAIRNQRSRRVKNPDDPDIRVRLSDNFRAELARHKAQDIIDKLEASFRGSCLHASSISRYARGEIAPKLKVARKLAKVLGWEPEEALAGYAERYNQPTLDWGRILFYSRHFRDHAAAFFELFRALILPNVHLGFPGDNQRGWRAHTCPHRNFFGYACAEITFDQPLAALLHGSSQLAPDSAFRTLRSAPNPNAQRITHSGFRTPHSLDVVLSYRLFEKPVLFIDYARITIDAAPNSRSAIRYPQSLCAHAVEIWTRREHRIRLPRTARSFWIATWVDGKAIDFIARSRHPFRVSPIMLPEADLPPNRRPMIRFQPGPIHRHGLAEEP